MALLALIVDLSIQPSNTLLLLIDNVRNISRINLSQRTNLGQEKLMMDKIIDTFIAAFMTVFLF